MEKSKSKSKPNTTVKAKKSASSPKAVTTRKTKIAKSMPNEDEIRAKAEEIYFDRISKGEHGTPEEDWLRAEALLKR